jgi:hypothetical protein
MALAPRFALIENPVLKVLPKISLSGIKVFFACTGNFRPPRLFSLGRPRRARPDNAPSVRITTRFSVQAFGVFYRRVK